MAGKVLATCGVCWWLLCCVAPFQEPLGQVGAALPGDLRSGLYPGRVLQRMGALIVLVIFLIIKTTSLKKQTSHRVLTFLEETHVFFRSSVVLKTYLVSK